MTEQRGVVIALNISNGGIPKRPLPAAEITFAGLIGDAHNHEKHNTPLQAVSLIDVEDLDALRQDGFDVYPGATGENVTLAGADIDACQIGDVLSFDGGVTVELTKVRKPCYVLDAISPDLKKAIAGRCGFYAKVIAVGTLRPGARMERRAVLNHAT